MPSGDAEPTDADLDRLARQLQAACLGGRSKTGGDERDPLFLAEAEALVQRFRGELRQIEADAFYGRALAGVRAQRPSSPAALLREARICFKLRDLAGARECAQSSRAASSAGAPAAASAARGLLPAEKEEALRLLRDAALFARDAAATRALSDELRATSAKGEETARPIAMFPALLSSAAGATRAQASSDDAAIAAALRSLMDLLRRHHLPPRGREIVALLAGDAATELGDLEVAAEIFLAAGRTGDAWLDASVSGRLGTVRSLAGDYEAAAVSLEEARSLAQSLPGAGALAARAGINLSRTLLGLGDLERARREALSVLALKAAPLDLRLRGRLLLGDCLYETARGARETLNDAEAAFLAVKRELASKEAAALDADAASELGATVAINLGNVARLRSQSLTGEARTLQRKQALQLEDSALRSAERRKDWSIAAVAAANIGELCLEDGDAASARSFVTWALEVARARRSFETEWRCHWYLGRLADAAGDVAGADAAYADAASLIEAYRSRVLDAERKSGFLTDKMDFYEDLVRRQIRSGLPDLALGTAERARARALVDSLGWRFIALANPRESALYREYVGLLARTERARAGGGATLWSGQRPPADFDALRGRLESLKRTFAADADLGPAFRALVDGDAAEAPAILAHLPSGATLIEYFAVPDGLVALVGPVAESPPALQTPASPGAAAGKSPAAGRIAAVRLPILPEELEKLVPRFLRSGASDAQAARRLCEGLFDPLRGLIRGERVVIVPFGAIHQLPFETLRDDKGFLVTRWDFSYLPSSSVLKHLRRRPGTDARAPLSLLAVVDPDTDYNRDGRPDMIPLPEARQEVSGFAKFFGQRVVLEGSAALERASVEKAGSFDVIHFACHGEFYPARPWASALFLARGPSSDGLGGDDGRLLASEVYALDLRRSRLVALSGCETGRSAVTPGEDAVSLGTAFLHSGASSLLLSLWKVEDAATAALMQAFYDRWLRRGQDKGRALRESKLELLAGKYPQPKQWGAFVLVGDRDI